MTLWKNLNLSELLLFSFDGALSSRIKVYKQKVLSEELAYRKQLIPGGGRAVAPGLSGSQYRRGRGGRGERFPQTLRCSLRSCPATVPCVVCVFMNICVSN